MANIGMLEVLKLKLGNSDIQYFTDAQYTIYLGFHGLDTVDYYNNDTHKEALLETVLEILNDMSTNMDTMRKIASSELGGDVEQAYTNLTNRIDRIKKEIDDNKRKQFSDNNPYGFIGIYRS